MYGKRTLYSKCYCYHYFFVSLCVHEYIIHVYTHVDIIHGLFLINIQLISTFQNTYIQKYLFVYISREIPLDFDIDYVLTELFKTLRLIKPIISYFTSEDNIGVLDHFNWMRPLRSATWLFIFTVVFGYFPQFAWPLCQVLKIDPDLFCSGLLLF
jgi:hypothetical protein